MIVAQEDVLEGFAIGKNNCEKAKSQVKDVYSVLCSCFEKLALLDKA